MFIGIEGNTMEEIVKEMKTFIKNYEKMKGVCDEKTTERKTKKKADKNDAKEEITLSKLIQIGFNLISANMENEEKIGEIIKKHGIERLSKCPKEKLDDIYQELVKL